MRWAAGAVSEIRPLSAVCTCRCVQVSVCPHACVWMCECVQVLVYASVGVCRCWCVHVSVCARVSVCRCWCVQVLVCAGCVQVLVCAHFCMPASVVCQIVGVHASMCRCLRYISMYTSMTFACLYMCVPDGMSWCDSVCVHVCSSTCLF